MNRQFFVNNAPLPVLPESDTYRYLGRPFGLEDQPDSSAYKDNTMLLFVTPAFCLVKN